MAVGKGSILRAGSASAAVKEKETETAEAKSKEEPAPFHAVAKVPPALLKPVPKAWGIPRVEETQAERLAGSIQKFGMLLPVLAYKNKKQDVLILKGYHRAAAAQKAGLEEVPVTFLEAASDSEARAAFAELRSFGAVREAEKGYEVISSITSSMPPYLL